MINTLYLASQSPRRRELLAQIGVPFHALSVDIDESVKPNEKPENYVKRLAKEKALSAWKLIENSEIKNTGNKAILGSDTAVVVNGQILGKPTSTQDARNMLSLLSGQTHQVITSVALLTSVQSPHLFELSETLCISDVKFKVLSTREIEEYIDSGECNDKAGSYAIQGFAAVFITHISGSYSGVMGLPLYETAELLNNAGISVNPLVVS